MMTNAIIGTVGAYVLLAALLLSLNIASLWRWWIKAGAIVVTALVFAGSYVAITGLIGWPSTGAMPTRFSLLSTRIVEPDALHDTPGHIYLWVEEIDDNQIVISAPRSYEVPYKVELAADVAAAQEQLEGGSDVLGQMTPDNAESSDHEASTNKAGDEVSLPGNAQQEGESNGASGIAADFASAATLSFSDMPPVGLPDKGPLNIMGN